MKIVKPAKIPMLTRVLEFGRRTFFHTTGVIAFPLESPRSISDELGFWKLTSMALGENGVFDEGFAKVRGELLVCGSFFAPEGKPLPASYVRARVGSIDKRLSVLGDRMWHNNVPSAPVPMNTMPIDWAHAFGGPEFERNPYGKGIEATTVDGRSVIPLPNIERYGALIRSPADRPEPAGFLPMDVTFTQRRSRAGTYDKRWLEEHFPGLAPDMEQTYFNVAPEDQWIEGFFRGDESFVVEHLHPEKSTIEGQLPGLAVRTFVTHATPEGQRFLEIPMRCDLVWLFPSVGLGAVVFHGSMSIGTDDAADIIHLVGACEELDQKRPAAHYEAVLARRLDKDKGALAGISDVDLMPPRDSGIIANIGGGDIGRWVKGEKLLQANMRRGEERRVAEARARLEALGLDPDTHGAPKLEAAAAAPDTDDLDATAAYAEAQLARIDDLKKEVEEKEAETKQKAKAALADLGEDYDAMMARKDKEGKGPPKFSAAQYLEKLESMAKEAREEGVPNEEFEQQIADPEFRALLFTQEKQLRELYFRFGHYQTTADALDEDGSHRAVVLIELARDTKESLSGRDLTGARLAGKSLARLDLSQGLLEAADLSGSDLSGTNLEGAMLAKANLEKANLKGAKLRGANLGGANLKGAILDGADLTGATLSEADLTGASLARVLLAEVQWMGVKLVDVDFSGASMPESNLIKADLRGVRFIGAHLSRAHFVECTLTGADFSQATLEKTGFVLCNGEGVLFREACLRQAMFVHESSFPRADFSDAEMEKTNLRGTVLVGARFERANMKGADLSSCDASGAIFDGATLEGGVMIRTNLTGASFKATNLMDVLASKAVLSRADFAGANLFRADLSRVIGDAQTSFAGAEVSHVRFLPKAVVSPGQKAPERGES